MANPTTVHPSEGGCFSWLWSSKSNRRSIESTQPVHDAKAPAPRAEVAASDHTAQDDGNERSFRHIIVGSSMQDRLRKKASDLAPVLAQAQASSATRP